MRELADALQLLTDVVRNTKAIVEAVNDGRKYLESRHPDARADFAELLREMEATIVGLAEVTKVISAFRFVPEGAAADAEPARFNTYVIEQRAEVAKLKAGIRGLKGSCEKVRLVRDALHERSGSRDWGSMFGLLGAAGRRQAGELAGTLSNFYADDQRLIEAVETMLKLAEGALAEVDEALGPPGHAYPHLVPMAAAVLQTYAAVFKEPQRELDELIASLDEAIAALV